MKAVEVRKIVKDNGLNLIVKGRTNGMVNVELTENTNDVATLNELLNGFGYELQKRYTGFYLNPKA
jgi:hypothetical protein